MDITESNCEDIKLRMQLGKKKHKHASDRTTEAKRNKQLIRAGVDAEHSKDHRSCWPSRSSSWSSNITTAQSYTTLLLLTCFPTLELTLDQELTLDLCKLRLVAPIWLTSVSQSDAELMARWST